MPQLVRLYLRSVAIGFGLAAVFSGALIWLDVAGIGHLILGSDIGAIAALMLLIFNGIVFSAVQFGIAVMGMAEDDDPRGGLGQHAGLIPIRVEAPSRQRKG
ncbi:MAG: hypothetical protein C0524_05160 [Rhodobacter sp.]|nr:hypothetical protein [Rhodobacter sp.]